MPKSCQNCQNSFEITDSDLEFYDKISPTFNGLKYAIPSPSLCPTCRAKRRMAWRGKEYFFRKCDKTGKNHLSIYPPEAQMITYSPEAFYADDWSGLEYGREFDFNKSFFEQFFELWKVTPKNIGNANHNENCEYIINAHKNKNCYLADEIDESRDCLYGYNIQKCEDIVNGFYVTNSKIGYELSQSSNCYEVFFSHNVHNCSNGAFLRNCRNVTNSIFCTNLRNKEYCVFNREVGAEEFKRIWDRVFTGNYQDLRQARDTFDQFLQEQIHPANTIINGENCSGDYLSNTQNCLECFNVDNSKDCKYCTDIHYSKDCYDTHIYEGELIYECLHAGPKGYNQLFSHLSWFSSNVIYVSEVHHCTNLFGCSGMKRQNYCILNKQYSEKDYEIMIARIIEKMKADGQWGEFFPVEYSPFGYNQTMAAYYWPLDRNRAQKQGFNWSEDKLKDQNKFPIIPDRLEDIDKNNLIFSSIGSGQSYRIIEAELKFHQKFQIPLPKNTPAERVFNFVKENPRKLYKRACDHCHKEIQSTCKPKDGVQVYCESCYLVTIH